MALTHSPAARNAIAAAVAGLVDRGSASPSGRLVIRDISGAAISTLQLSNPAFLPAFNGSAVMNVATPDNSPDIGAVPVTFEFQDRDGNVVFSGTCGTSGADMATNGNVLLAASTATDIAYNAAP